VGEPQSRRCKASDLAMLACARLADHSVLGLQIDERTRVQLGECQSVSRLNLRDSSALGIDHLGTRYR
jgi:hypothetical protein